MADEPERSNQPAFPASALHKVLLRLGLPRLMADHTAALVAATMPRRRRRGDDRGGDHER